MVKRKRRNSPGWFGTASDKPYFSATVRLMEEFLFNPSSVARFYHVNFLSSMRSLGSLPISGGLNVSKRRVFKLFSVDYGNVPSLGY